MNDELTTEQTKRQDEVDNAIMQTVLSLVPEEKQELFAWDVHFISQIRNEMREWVVEHIGAMTEQEFYPFISHCNICGCETVPDEMNNCPNCGVWMGEEN